MDIKSTKLRFGIIGNDLKLSRAINVALQVASTDISVLINGESGTGKETIPQIIHQNSKRKHNNYIAVNCGAIPEGTIDSELFGHEKGSFTGANESRKGYFEAADNGTIFLDEIAELPLPSQARLLRVLENGEFIKVGSSKPQKTNVRILAATNENMLELVKKGKFREDLYYRLSTVEIKLPALRDRKEDIHLLFRKFSSDFALKYKMPSIKLDNEALELLINYHWNGNIRQLKNVAEQISVLERERNIEKETLINYLPNSQNSNLPAIIKKGQDSSDFSNEREILYKVLFDMKSDLNDLKKLTMELMKNDNMSEFQKNNENLIQKIYEQDEEVKNYPIIDVNDNQPKEIKDNNYQYVQELDSQETLSLHDKELELIKKSLERHEGKRKLAAKELGISERTLYRKIKQFDL